MNSWKRKVTKISSFPFLRGLIRSRKLRQISESPKQHWIFVPWSFSFPAFDLKLICYRALCLGVAGVCAEVGYMRFSVWKSETVRDNYSAASYCNYLWLQLFLNLLNFSNIFLQMIEAQLQYLFHYLEVWIWLVK